MKHLRAAAVAVALLACAPAMSACAGITGSGAVTVPANVKAAATKAMIDCEVAYQAVAVTVNQGKASGLLTGDNAAKADAIKRQAWAALMVARQAYATGVSPNVATLASLLMQVQALTKGAA